MKSRFLAPMVAVAAILVPASAAVAAPANYTCRASALYVNLGGQGTVEPLVANRPENPCKDDGSTVPSLSAKDALGPKTVDATSQTAFALTNLAGAGGPAYQQTAASQSGVENLDLNLGGGQLHIQAQAAYATAGARCLNGKPDFPTYVKLIGLTINDMKIVGGTDASIPASSSLTGAFDQLSDSQLGGVITVRTEKTVKTATGATVEAARIELLKAAGTTPLLTVVIGASKAGVVGDVCAVPTPPVTGTGGGGGGGGTNTSTTTTTTTPPNNTASNTGSNAGAVLGATAPPRVNGVNGSGCARMTIFWDLKRTHAPATSGPTSVKSRFGVRHIYRGRVVNCRGQGIVNAKLDVVHYIRGNMKRMKTGIRTRGGGKFTLINSSNLKSRRIVVTYRGFVNRPKVATRKTLRIVVLNRFGRILR